jgi:hypothetical protein
MIVDAYQTLEDRDNIDEIEMDGPFKCTHSKSWLGIGYYLWDTNVEWAITWGEVAHKKNGADYVIAKCKINLANQCFDLVGNVQHQQDLIEVIKVMKESGRIKNSDEETIPNLIMFMKAKGIFNFKTIRAADMHDKVVKLQFLKYKKEYMIINQRVQICVIEKKDVLLRPFSVVFPEKYLY